MFKLFYIIFFCDDLFADDGADESRSFASDSLATLTVGALCVSHNSCVVYCISHSCSNILYSIL